MRRTSTVQPAVTRPCRMAIMSTISSGITCTIRTGITATITGRWR